MEGNVVNQQEAMRHSLRLQLPGVSLRGCGVALIDKPLETVFLGPGKYNVVQLVSARGGILPVVSIRISGQP
jgi:hypothetical protein